MSSFDMRLQLLRSACERFKKCPVWGCRNRASNDRDGWKADIAFGHECSHFEWMIRSLRRFPKWVAKLNIAERLAALACVAAVLVAFLTRGPTSGDFKYEQTIGEVLLRILLLPLAWAFMLPFVAAPQLGIFFLVSRSRFKVLSYLMVAVSGVLLAFYFLFLRAADLSTSSTAALAVPFYPLWQAMYALPVLAAAHWAIHRLLPPTE